MSRKRYTAEQILGMVREAEVRLSQGEKIGLICKSLGISEQSYYRWRKEYGGLKSDQAKRLKDLEKENTRLWPAPNQWSSWLERARTFPRYCGLMDLGKTVCGAGGLYPRELCGLTVL